MVRGGPLLRGRGFSVYCGAMDEQQIPTDRPVPDPNSSLLRSPMWGPTAEGMVAFTELVLLSSGLLCHGKMKSQHARILSSSIMEIFFTISFHCDSTNQKRSGYDGSSGSASLVFATCPKNSKWNGSELKTTGHHPRKPQPGLRPSSVYLEGLGSHPGSLANGLVNPS